VSASAVSLDRDRGVRIHPTAEVEPGATVGAGTTIWDHVHVREDTHIGRGCIVGEKTYVAYGVRIGDFVKINANVYICTAVEIEDLVMISAHTVFTNDLLPRAFSPDLSGLETSAPTDRTLRTVVRRGVTIGANATIGPGLEIGEFAMVGMGSVVTRDVPPFALVHGNPARLRGYVCMCGDHLGDADQFAAPEARPRCERCGRRYAMADGRVRCEEDPFG
jgi:UDP-2-acetamido-3-amino-2,3-dideoxy-glucuronate N-acetyltransferase